MNQLKKIFLGLAVTVALGLIGANNASAQNGTCTAGSVPTLVRSQGIAELTGAITLSSCTTGLNSTSAAAATGAALSFSLTDTIQPSAAVITNSPTVGTAAADFIPTSTITVNCINGVAGTGTATVTSGLALAPAQAITCGAAPGVNNLVTIVGVVSGNTVTFGYTIATTGGNNGTVATLTGLAIGPVPGLLCSNANTFCNTVGVTGTATAGAFNATVGIRANIFASGIVFPAEIAGLLTSSPPGLLSITNNFLNVAIPQNGLSATITAGTVITNCATKNISAAPTTLAYVPSLTVPTFSATDPVTGVGAKAPGSVVLVTVAEGFSSSFLIGGAGAGSVGGEGFDSSQGTRVVITFGSLPTNTILVAANSLKAGGNTAGVGPLELDLVPAADTNGAGAASANPVAPLGGTTGATVLSGNTVTYEVAANSTAAGETIAIPIGVYTIGTPTPFGTSTVSVQMGPVSTVGTPITTPIPRFGSSPTSGNALTIAPCLSNIFVTWAANTAGYDTGFAITNSTTDIFGTASQSGTCIYNFFGTNSPSGGTFTTAAFGGGTVDTRLLSNIAPGFFGYIIIQCNFQLGHGFEFIVNGFGGGTPTVGEGGQSLIIPQPTTIGVGAGSRKAFAGLGEVLGH